MRARGVPDRDGPGLQALFASSERRDRPPATTGPELYATRGAKRLSTRAGVAGARGEGPGQVDTDLPIEGDVLAA